MASKHSLLPIKGTYNGINYYIQDGEQRQRKAGGGFTSESIKNNPNMQGVRNSNKELALCSSFNRSFKEALAPMLHDLKDGTRHRRLMKLFMQLKTLDEAPVGERTVGAGLCCDMGRKILREFEFTLGMKSRDVLGPVLNLDKETGTLYAIAFDLKRLKFPKGTTHVGFEYAVLAYNLKDNIFHFTPSTENVMFEAGEEARELVFEPAGKPEQGCEVFGAVKIQYYQKLPDRLYKSQARGGAGILVV
ncbi:hypothetical protein [Aequorivita echinoideorum]|uniref:Uncharacterized protein n=1 Tax=Aequorivita echinoideorum TaxID=1549647 RepID=A0ABS5S001_9FLAO|nr:hypothetical protein [Aequorivita echinoideorum]MBT0606553.1 hypothetical protein [Aequorivita echinoideorum]